MALKSTAHQARSGYLTYVVVVFIFIVIGLLVWNHFDNKIKKKTVKRDAVHSTASVSPLKRSIKPTT